MRYAYGESPHWCTLPVPAEVASLPRCEQCGSMRVFEMQLMPALLSLPLPTPPASNVSSSSTSETLEDRLGDALDFGTVAIYTCPNSCSTDGEGKLVREFVIVQPPSDIRG